MPVFGRDFYDRANWVATFLLEIFYAKCAVTIFSQRAREYALINFDSQMIFYCYLLCRLTAKNAVIRHNFLGIKVEMKYKLT